MCQYKKHKIFSRTEYFFILDTDLDTENFALVEIKYHCKTNFAATIHTINTGIDKTDISYFVSHFDLIFQILEGIVHELFIPFQSS